MAEIASVKRTQHGIITDPHTIRNECTVSEAVRRMGDTGVGTLMVVDDQRRLTGLLTERGSSRWLDALYYAP